MAEPFNFNPGSQPAIIGPNATPATQPTQQAPAPQTPPQTAPDNPPTNSPQGGIDPDVQTFTKAIAMQEGGGKLLSYDAPGGDGSIGRYQFTPATWNNYAQQVLGSPDAPMTSANQNEVAYTKLNQWHQQGYTWAQMASMWNAGEGSPDSWKPGTVQAHGDTPDYVKNVQKYAQQLDQKQSEAATGYVTPQGTDPNAAPVTQPSAPSGGTSDPSGGFLSGLSEDLSGTNPDNIGTQLENTVKGAGNFLFPIAGDAYNDITGKNQKTALQQAGDAGLSLLPFIPGLGEAGEAARGGEAVAEGGADVAKSGILQKLLGSTTAKGAATGYGAGVLNNLSQGQGVGQSLMPGLSTLGGAATGGLLGAVAPRLAGLLKSSFTEQGAVDSATKGLTDELSRTSPGRQLLSNLPEKGARATKLLTASGALPTVEGTHFNVDDAIDNMEGRLAQLGQARAGAIDTLHPTISLDDLATQAKTNVGNAPADAGPAAAHVALQRTMSGEAQGMEDKIDTIINNIKTKTGRSTISAQELQALKEVQTANSGVFRRTGAIGDQNAASLLGEAAKSKMESLAKDAGFPGLQEYNKHMADHYDAIKVLQRLRQQSVKGGRLGNMLTGHVVGAVAAGAANAAGGGFLGSIASLLAGESGGNFISKLMNSGQNPLRAALLDKMEAEDPAIVQELKNFSGKTEDVAPLKKAKPPSKSAGILPSLLIKGGARVGSAAGGMVPSI